MLSGIVSAIEGFALVSLAVAAALIAIVLVIVVFPRINPRLGARLAKGPLRHLVIEQILRGAEKRGWKGVEEAAELVRLGVIEPLRVAALAAKLRDCPSSSALRILHSLGLYEEIAKAAARGCSVDSGVLEEARRYFIAAGLPKWEEGVARILGVQSFYERAVEEPVYAYCRGYRAWARVGGETIELTGIPGPSAHRDPREALEALLTASRPPVYVFMGDCPRPLGVRWVDARHLFSIAYPDVDPSLASVAFNLNVSVEDPGQVVEAAARAAKAILESVGADWDRLPATVTHAQYIPPAQPPIPQAPGVEVIVTDRPRAVLPLLKPYTVEPPSEDRGAKGWDYAAILALKALRARWGDPARAFTVRRGNPLDDLLPRLIAGSLRRRPPETPPKPYQVEPWHARQIERGATVAIDCIRPPSACIEAQELPEWERKLMEAAGSLPGALEPRPWAQRVKVKPLQPLPPSLAERLGERGPEPEGLRILVSRVPRTPCGLAGVARKMVSGSRVLVIAPSRPLASAIGRCMGVKILSGEAVEAWAAEGGVIAIDYDTLLEAPWILGVADSTVVLFPERIVAKYSRISVSEDLLWETASVAYALGGNVVSRALRILYNDGLLSRVAPVEADAEEGGWFELEDLIEYSKRVFEELWGRVVPGAKLRGYQEDSLHALYRSIENGRPGMALVVLPTGAGKSAIFQVASRVLADAGVGAAALVISPLKALIHDQVRGALSKGLKASYIDSSVPLEERRLRVKLALAGILDLLYVTPERFQDPVFESIAREAESSLVVLDEAHTLSRWGLSFRPSYLLMAKVIRETRSEKGWPPVLALTATAPSDVVADVLEAMGYRRRDAVEEQLDLDSPPRHPVVKPGGAIVLRAPPLRKEIRLDVRPAPRDWRERLDDLVSLVSELSRWAEGSREPWVGVVYTGYVRSQKMPLANAETVAKILSEALGMSVSVYHGQLSESARRRVEEAIVKASREGRGARIVVATKAFGMGVDIPNIRFVVHLTPSDSVEDYYQEVGRAGRDRRLALAVAYYNPEDFAAKRRLKAREAVKPSEVLKMYNFIVGASSLSKSRSRVLLPLEVLAKVLGSEERASRALEILRASGLLEYSISVGAPVEANGEECLWDLPGTCIGLGERPGIRLEYRICTDQESLAPTLSVLVKGKRRGACSNGQHIVPARWTRYAYIELSPWMEHGVRGSLPIDVFVKVVRGASAELEKIEDLQALLSKGLEARVRGGQAAADQVLRRGIEEYLEKEATRLKALDTRILGRTDECRSVRECSSKAARVALMLEQALGRHGYTVVATSEDLAKSVKKELESKLGRSVPDPLQEYRRMMASARRRGASSLMNRGVIILVTREGTRSARAALERLAEHPYKYVLIQRS